MEHFPIWTWDLNRQRVKKLAAFKRSRSSYRKSWIYFWKVICFMNLLLTWLQRQTCQKVEFQAQRLSSVTASSDWRRKELQRLAGKWRTTDSEWSHHAWGWSQVEEADVTEHPGNKREGQENRVCQNKRVKTPSSTAQAHFPTETL